jgi:hypothetical protein
VPTESDREEELHLSSIGAARDEETQTRLHAEEVACDARADPVAARWPEANDGTDGSARSGEGRVGGHAGLESDITRIFSETEEAKRAEEFRVVLFPQPVAARAREDRSGGDTDVERLSKRRITDRCAADRVGSVEAGQSELVRRCDVGGGEARDENHGRGGARKEHVGMVVPNDPGVDTCRHASRPDVSAGCGDAALRALRIGCYWLALKPLSMGTHTLRFNATLPGTPAEDGTPGEDFVQDLTYTIVVK